MQSLVDLRRGIEAGSLTPEDAIVRSRHAIATHDAGLRASPASPRPTRSCHDTVHSPASRSG
jgi:hypothetical protein